MTRQYAKRCDVADFTDPELARTISDVWPAQHADRPHRKAWEFAMAALFLDEVGRLDGEAEILDVGAGSDAILFWLANRARRVVAIDIYGDGPFAGGEAAAAMLDDPSAHAPYPFCADRLEVRHMDARRLEFPDASFDAVVSFSSIEHFGGPEGIAASAREIGRVLRPGGHAFLVTEAFVDFHWLEAAPVQFAIRLATLGRRCAVATPRRRAIEVLKTSELQRDIVTPSGLQLMQPLDLAVTAATRATVQTISTDGRVTSATGEPYPHVLLQARRSTFTSIALPLVKA